MVETLGFICINSLDRKKHINMRILSISSYYKPAYIYGGPVKSISAMCEGLAILNQDVTVLTTNANGSQRLNVPLGKPIDIDGVKIIYYPINSGLPASYYYSPSLAKAIKQEIHKFDIVIIEGLFSYIVRSAVASCQKYQKPYIIPPRGQLLPWSLGQKRVKKYLYLKMVGYNYLNHAAAIHCTDQYELEILKHLNIRSPLFVVGNGIDTNKYMGKERGIFRNKYGIPADGRVLLFLGRLHVKKRPDIALRTFANVFSVYPNAYFFICGPDEQLLSHKLMQEAYQLGCSDRVFITGLINGDQIPQVLADADLVVMPSELQSENFGMSAVEALAAGVPVLVSKGIPIGARIEHEGIGRIASTSVNEFSNAAIQMFTNMQELKDMGNKGQIFVQQNYDINIIAKKMLRQYQSIYTTGKPLLENE